MNILILGITGMLGHAMFRLFASSSSLTTYGTARTPEKLRDLPAELQKNIHYAVDASDLSRIREIIEVTKPEVTINCIGLIKQYNLNKKPIDAIAINALFPHQVSAICQQVGSRFIHISTDCVFSGCKGQYSETDPATAEDIYGRTKFLGEVIHQEHVLTLRTSIIGHELDSQLSLIDWFLSQENDINGYTKAIFSGLPTNELASVIKEIILPNDRLQGLYHLAAKPITKYDLLRLISEYYQKEITITPDEAIVIDRSLNAEKFQMATGYTPPEWPELISNLYQFRQRYYEKSTLIRQ